MDTTNERKAGALILSQISMFNEAVLLFGKTVEPEILGAIDKIVEDFCNANEWVGIYYFKDNKACYFGLKAWNRPKEPVEIDLLAKFSLDGAAQFYDYWTAVFYNVSIEGTEAGFIFAVDPKAFGGKNLWNNYAKNIDQEIIGKLESSGFKNQGKGGFFLPFHLDATLLASAYEDTSGIDFEHEAFDPIREALETIKANIDLFQSIISNGPLISP